MRRGDVMAAGATILLAVLLRLPTLAQPLLEKQAFRQTQTAYTALTFHESGIDLLHPQVPVLGPPFEVAFELPLFQALATIPMALGLAPDPSLRVTSLACIALAAALLWRLMFGMAGAVPALVALVAFLFSPFAFVWSRAATMEYLVVAASLAYLSAGLAWREDRRPSQWVCAVVAGCVAMAVKVTSGFFWLLPLLAYRPRRDARLRDPWLLGLLGIPLAAGLAWTGYADAVRAAGPGTSWMTSVALAPFLFGPPEQRLDAGVWAKILSTAGVWLVGPGLVGLLAAVPPTVRRGEQRIFWSALILAPFLSIAIFLNLYSVHDYYLAAATPAVAAALGLAAGSVWRGADVAFVALAAAFGVLLAAGYLTLFVPPVFALTVAVVWLCVVGFGWLAARRARRAPPRFIAGMGLAALLLSVVATADYWRDAYAPIADRDGVLPRAAELARLSRPDEEVLVVGRDWSPDLLYYARRRGQMLPPALLDPAFVDRLESSRHRTMAAWDPDTDPLWPASRWSWIGAIGAHTYSLAGSPAELRGADVAASDDSAAFAEASRSGRALSGSPFVVRCGTPAVLPAGAAGTWLRLASAPRDARLGVSPDLAPVPARQVVVIAGGAADGAVVHLTCAGADSLIVVEAIDAPPPR